VLSFQKYSDDFEKSQLGLLFNLEECFWISKKYTEAEQMYQQELKMCQKVLGQEHLSTLSSMNNLALVLDRQGRYTEAEQMH
jgi:tetratricopeptide (TPR) repeat protein